MTHQLIENRYIIRVGEKRSIALRCCGERRSIHSGEDVGERAGRTELCPGPGIAGDPLALRRVYRSDVLISQLRERHGGRKKGGKSLLQSHKARGIASISTFTVWACERQKVRAREVYISSGTASVNDPVAPLIFFLFFFFPPSLPYWSGWTKVRSLQIALDYWDSLAQIDISSRLEAPPISQISPSLIYTKQTLSLSLSLSTSLPPSLLLSLSLSLALMFSLPLSLSLPLLRISALTSGALIWMEGFQISFYGSPIYFICYFVRVCPTIIFLC